MKIKSIYSTLFGEKDENRLSVSRANHLIINTKEPVDREKLKEAANRALSVCPYIGYDILVEGGFCYYCENDAPLTVLENAPQAFGDAENNGHLASLCASGNRIDFTCSHALTDGCGMSWFLDALLKFYYGYEEEIVYRGSGEPDYFADLMEKQLPVPDDYVFKDYSAPYSFRIPESGRFHDLKSIAGAEALSLTTFDYALNRKELDSFCESVKCSHTVAMFYFLTRAVRLVHPDARRISCRVPVNARRIMGVENTFQNCSLNQVILSLGEETLKERSEREEIAALKALMKEQLDPGYIAYCINQYAAYLKKEGDTSHFGDLMRGMDQSFMISDMGEVLSGSILNHASFCMARAYTGLPVTIYMASLADRVFCEINQVFEEEIYANALEEIWKTYHITFSKIQEG